MLYEQMWGPIIAWYLFLAGVGAGSFVTAALLRWKCPEARRLRLAALIIAPVVVAIGLVLLIVDAEAGLRNPLRFVYLLTNFGSVMTWGVVFLSLFMAIVVVTLLIELLKKKVPALLWIAGVVMSVCVAGYTGALLGVCLTYPLWNNGLLPVLFLVSALSAGMAAVLLAGAIFFPSELAEAGIAKKVHFVLPILEIVLIAAVCVVTAQSSDAGWESAMGLLTGEWALLFWLLLVGVGLVAPLVIELFSLFIASHEFERTPAARGLGVAADTCVLVGGFMLRFLIVMAAVPLAFVV